MDSSLINRADARIVVATHNFLIRYVLVVPSGHFFDHRFDCHG